MEELIIYKYQAKEIAETLRIIANILHSHSETTCADRMVMKSTKFINEVLEKSKTK